MAKRLADNAHYQSPQTFKDIENTTLLHYYTIIVYNRVVDL